MSQICIRCGNSMDLLPLNKYKCRCCGYEYTGEEIVTLFPLDETSYIFEVAVRSRRLSCSNIVDVNSQSEKNIELGKLCRVVSRIPESNYGMGRKKELIKVCQVFNGVAEKVYQDALERIPISELLVITTRENVQAASINEVIKMVPVGELKRAIDNY